MTEDFELVDEFDVGKQPDPLILISDAQRIVLEPGDVLVVMADQPIPHTEQKRLHGMLCEIFPNNQILILERGLRIAVLGSLER